MFQQPLHLLTNYLVTADYTMLAPLDWGVFSRVDFAIVTEALNGAPSAATLDWKLQQQDEMLKSAWTDIAGKAITQLTQATSLSSPNLQIVSVVTGDFINRMRFFMPVAFTGGTTPSWKVNVSAYVRGG